jgi:hypothetical protein
MLDVSNTEGLMIDRMDHFMGITEESLRMADKRIEFLEMLEWSFLLADVRTPTYYRALLDSRPSCTHYAPYRLSSD